MSRDYQTGACQGCGLVSMEAYENAARAIQSLHGTTLANRILHVALHTK